MSKSKFLEPKATSQPLKDSSSLAASELNLKMLLLDGESLERVGGGQYQIDPWNGAD
jgi:hypothetical protein